jgi:hypothetical protein
LDGLTAQTRIANGATLFVSISVFAFGTARFPESGADMANESA